MYIQKVTAQTIAVSGTGQAAETAITLPSTFIPAAGAIYDILLKTQIPEGTNGTIVMVKIFHQHHVAEGEQHHQRKQTMYFVPHLWSLLPRTGSM